MTIIRSRLEQTMPADAVRLFYWCTEMNRVKFYVEDAAIAKALREADRKIAMPDGVNLIIQVHAAYPPAQLPPHQVEQQRELMKLAMAKRYAADRKALDLRHFHADPTLLDIYCGLSHKKNMLAVIDIIKQNIPDLEALNLSANKIYAVDAIRTIVTQLPDLKMLHLGDNKVRVLRLSKTTHFFPFRWLIYRLNLIQFDRYDIRRSVR